MPKIIIKISFLMIFYCETICASTREFWWWFCCWKCVPVSCIHFLGHMPRNRAFCKRKWRCQWLKTGFRPGLPAVLSACGAWIYLFKDPFILALNTFISQISILNTFFRQTPTPPPRRQSDSHYTHGPSCQNPHFSLGASRPELSLSMDLPFFTLYFTLESDLFQLHSIVLIFLFIQPSTNYRWLPYKKLVIHL